MEFNEKILLGIERVSHEVVKGNNFLLVESVAVADHLFSIYGGDMSLFSKKVINKAKVNLPTLNSILKKNFVCISLVDDVNLRDYNKKINIADLHLFDVGRPVLVCENMTDSKIFEHSAKCYLAQNRLISKFDVKCAVRGGGGNCISVEFKGIVESDKKFCLAITDGDNNFPGRKMSATSKKCNDIVISSSSTSGHLVLPVRDLENMIPFDVYLSALDVGMTDKIRKLQDIVGKSSGVAIHCDIKDGVSGDKFYSFEKTSSERVFLEGLVSRGVFSIDYNCITRDDCFDKNNCSCVLMPGVGNKSLERVLYFFDKNTPHKINEYFNGDYKSFWEEVGSFVASWAISPRSFESFIS